MNVLKPDKKSTIITLLKNGISQREISRKTSIDRKTVRKYANGSGLFWDGGMGSGHANYLKLLTKNRKNTLI